MTGPASIGWGQCVDQDGEADSLGIMLSDGSADAPLESIGATDSPAPDVLVVPPLLHATSAALSARNRTIRLIMWLPPEGYRHGGVQAVAGVGHPWATSTVRAETHRG